MVGVGEGYAEAALRPSKSREVAAPTFLENRAMPHKVKGLA